MAGKPQPRKFDWCINNLHEDCLNKYERFYFEHRRGKTIMHHTGEIVQCGCTCHKEKK